MTLSCSSGLRERYGWVRSTPSHWWSRWPPSSTWWLAPALTSPVSETSSSSAFPQASPSRSVMLECTSKSSLYFSMKPEKLSLGFWCMFHLSPEIPLFHVLNARITFGNVNKCGTEEQAEASNSAMTPSPTEDMESESSKASGIRKPNCKSFYCHRNDSKYCMWNCFNVWWGFQEWIQGIRLDCRPSVVLAWAQVQCVLERTKPAGCFYPSVFVQVLLHSRCLPLFSLFLLITTSVGAADTHTHPTRLTTTRSCCSMPSTRACSSPTDTAHRSVRVCVCVCVYLCVDISERTGMHECLCLFFSLSYVISRTPGVTLMEFRHTVW